MKVVNSQCHPVMFRSMLVLFNCLLCIHGFRAAAILSWFSLKGMHRVSLPAEALTNVYIDCYCIFIHLLPFALGALFSVLSV
jgi:hypothetical protein